MDARQLRAWMALKNLSIEIKALKAHLGGAGAGSGMFTGDAGKEDGVWRTTENGKKIFISKGGEITKGPKSLVGKNVNEGGSGGKSGGGSKKPDSGKGSSGKASSGGSAPKPKRERGKSVGKGLEMQEKYGGDADHDGVGNQSQGHVPTFKDGNGETKIVPHDIEEGDHSLKDAIDPTTGKISAERESMHNEIVNRHFEGVAKPDGQPTFYMMGGGPASGKSSILKSGMVDVPDKFNAVHVNSDHIKREIPEYQQRLKNKDASAAGYAHEESSALGKRVQDTAFKNGYNAVLDGTGDGSERSVMSKIEAARANGMRVEGYYVTIPTEEAVARNKKRAQSSVTETGRVVRDEVVRNTHKKVSQILPKVAKHFDKVELYDNTVRGAPKLIAYGGGGKDLTVVDKKLYDDFISKGR